MVKFLKFFVVGGLSTLIQFILLWFFVSICLINPVISSFSGYLLSSIFNYFANYHITFKSNAKHKETFPKFVAAVALGLSCNTLFFALLLSELQKIELLTQLLHEHTYLIAQLFATLLTLIINFTVHKIWIYR